MTDQAWKTAFWPEGVAANCNPVYTPAELNLQLKDSESKMVFCMDHPLFYPNTVKAIKDTLVETVVVCNIKSYLGVLPWYHSFGITVALLSAAMTGTDIKILSLTDPTKELPQGEDGEIAICGPQVMKGYWKRPDANEEVFTQIDGNRYFLTGDIGHIDDEGYILITDRKKDMIIVGGFNVYPRDVEDILYTHPKVELYAVIGIPDEKRGEKVKAFIKLKQGETADQDEIMAYCKENMAGYKRPRSVEFRDEIPISNIGKVLRRVLRDEAMRGV